MTGTDLAALLARLPEIEARIAYALRYQDDVFASDLVAEFVAIIVAVRALYALADEHAVCAICRGDGKSWDFNPVECRGCHGTGRPEAALRLLGPTKKGP